MGPSPFNKYNEKVQAIFIVGKWKKLAFLFILGVLKLYMILSKMIDTISSDPCVHNLNDTM